MKKRIISTLLAAAMILTAIPQVAVTVSADLSAIQLIEVKELAEPLELGVITTFTGTGVGLPLTERQIHEFEVSAAGKFRIQLSRAETISTLNERIDIYNADGGRVGGFVAGIANRLPLEYDETFDLSAGTYYLVLELHAGEHRIFTRFASNNGTINIPSEPFFMYSDLAKDLKIGDLTTFAGTGSDIPLPQRQFHRIAITHPGTLNLEISRTDATGTLNERVDLYNADGERLGGFIAGISNRLPLEYKGTFEVVTGTYYLVLDLGAFENKMLTTFTAPKCDWKDWIIDKAPTCTAAVLRERECKYCDETDEEVMPRLEHKLGAWNVASRATCSTDGLRTRSCGDCTYKDEDKTIKTGFGGSGGVCFDCGVSGRKLGDITGTGDSTIGDALEILKFLAKLPSEVTKNPCNHAATTITGGKDPVIGDALEILKYLAKLPSLVK
jgi:hypothetical protein